MSRKIPPLNALKSFEAAARHLSFTKASDELFVTQAAVSHQIKALEEFLGIKLFLRKNRSLLLTEEGQSYFLDIKDIFSSLVDATNKLLAKGAKGVVTVCLPPSFAIHWLVPRLSQFSELQPDIDVRIKASEHDTEELTDDVDIAVYYGKGQWPDLHADLIHRDSLAPVCSPLLIKEDKPLYELSDLRNYTLLHDSSRQNWCEWIRQFGITGVNVNQGPIFSHSTMVNQAAVLGQGIALAHSFLVQPEIDAGRLMYPFKERLMSRKSFYLVCRESQAELGKIVAFRDWLLAVVKAELPDD